MSETRQAVLSPPESVPPPEPGMLPGLLRHSTWLLTSSVTVRAVNFLRTAVLARLLVPEDFGLFGLASSILGFTLLFGDIGIGASLLYDREGRHSYRAAAFWLNFALGVLLMGPVVLLAPWLAAFFSAAALAPVLSLLAAAFFLQILSTVNREILRRELKFKALAVADLVSSVVSIAVAVSLAWRGYGVWAFVWSVLAANAVRYILFWWAARWQPGWSISGEAARSILTFSGAYLAATVFSYLALGLDRPLIGKLIGVEALGPYVLAYDVALVLASVITWPMQQVMVPQLVRRRDAPQRFWAAYLDYSRLAALLVLWIGAVIVVAGEDLILGLFGAGWTGAVVPFKFLAGFMLLRAVLGDAFAAWGRYDLSARVSLVLVAAGGPGIFLAAHWGINSVAAVVAAAGLSAYVAALRLTSGGWTPLAGILRGMWPFAWRAAVAGAAGAAAGAALDGGATTPALLRAAVTSAVIAGVYALLTRRHLAGLVALWRHPSPEPRARQQGSEA